MTVVRDQAKTRKMQPTFGEWTGKMTENLSLVHVRDSIVDCFTATHGPRFGETRAVLGLDDGEQAVRSSVQGIVTLAYTIAGGSFDNPTTETTTRVVNLLAERSACWGVPEDEVFEHHCEMMRKLGLIMLAESGSGPSSD